MTPAVAQILSEVNRLSLDERAELADRIFEGLETDIPPEVEREQLQQVRRRVAEVESGKAVLIPGEVVRAEVRQLLAELDR